MADPGKLICPQHDVTMPLGKKCPPFPVCRVFGGDLGNPDLCRIVRKNSESYREYAAGIFSGEAAQGSHGVKFILRTHNQLKVP